MIMALEQHNINRQNYPSKLLFNEGYYGQHKIKQENSYNYTFVMQITLVIEYLEKLTGYI